ncbi:MAG: Hsp33 family molecular chaperone HslO [Gammaproteobacteria bacterium]|nr:Hsp33 family molecular chaperone HslO [Gammaproteobacteria bacterium]
MPNNDLLHRFLIENTRVRGEMVHLNASWQAILERTNYPDNVRQILGEALAACALLSATIKFDGSLILQVRGDGPLHLLVAQANAQGALRGIAHWKGDVPKSKLQDIFGNAQMLITIKPEQGEPYQGIIALQGDTLKDAIENYFKQSEQLNTQLWLASDKDTCAGFLLQELPSDEADEDDSWNNSVQLAATLKPDEILDLPVKDLLHRLFHEKDIRLFDPEPLYFRCNCSNERIASMLLALGKEEVDFILQEQSLIEVGCEFCNANYKFDQVDIDALFTKPEKIITPSSKTIQ